MNDHPAGEPVGIRRSTRYLPELESLRGIAICLVFCFHALAVFWPQNSVRGTWVSPVHAFAYAGHTGVSLFFVLSSFLLSLPFLKEASGGPRVHRGDYLRRRALRILPLYYAAVIAATLITSEQWRDLLRVFPYLVFGNAGVWTTPMHPYSSVWWSLVTELEFYLVLPLLPLALATRRRRWIAAGLLLLYAAAYVAFARGQIQLGSYGAMVRLGDSVFGRGWAFLAGIAAAAIYRRWGPALRETLRGSAWVRRGGSDLLLLATLAALAGVLRWVVWLGPRRAELAPHHVWHVPEALLWAAVVLLVLLAPLAAKRLLHNRVFAELGVVSYSIYMLHLPLLSVGAERARELWPGVFQSASGALVVASAIAAATLLLALSTYRWIERPFLLRKARIDRQDLPAAPQRHSTAAGSASSP